MKVSLDTRGPMGELSFHVWQADRGWTDLGTAFKSESLKEHTVFPYISLKNGDEEKLQEI